jgi:hypothetical protein
MNAQLRARIKAWDREERIRATMEMISAACSGDIQMTKGLLSRFPLLDEWVPYQTNCWSRITAALGQLKLMNFWRNREKKTRPPSKRATPESLLFWTMGYEFLTPTKGDPVGVAKYLLDQGANIEGDVKDYSPLHRAVFMNRPSLVKLLIRRGANLSRRYLTGESALQIAKHFGTNKRCVILLERAGAPLELPIKPERPKAVRTVDLRDSFQKLQHSTEKAVRRFVRQHKREAVTAIALASVPHEGYVMVAFDTGKFQGSPWDCTYDQFAYAKFPDWSRAHEGDLLRVTDLDGRTASKAPEEFISRFEKMIVTVLRSLEQERVFELLTTALGCQIGVEMTGAGKGRFWRLNRSLRELRGKSSTG